VSDPCVVAVDVGTTGVKAAAVMRSGRILASAARGYPTRTQGAQVEQDPADWLAAAAGALAELSAQPGLAPEALVLSGQMQDLVLVGADPQAPAILYNDARAAAEAEEVARLHGAARHAAEAGNLQDATGLAPKLLWASRRWPEAVRGARALLLGAHDYLAWRLCGRAVTDLTTASTTGLLLLAENRWNLPLLSGLGLRTDWLPELLPADAVAGPLTPEAARATGLPAGLPVLHGAGDAATATLGSAAGEEGCLSLHLGTSGWVALTSAGPPAPPELGGFNLRHPDGRRLIAVGATTTAAGNHDWAREALGEGAGPLDQAAAEAPAGAGGLLYLPWLAGERSPFRDPEARAAFVGIGRDTGRAALARAVLEGVAFSLRSIQRALGGAGARAVRTTLVGGGARSLLWRRIVASAFDCPVDVPERPEEAGLRGAAILAGRHLGWCDRWDREPAFFGRMERCAPEPAWTEVYGRLQPVFDGMYAALRPAYRALADVRAGRKDSR
jgi:xylulokinase